MHSIYQSAIYEVVECHSKQIFIFEKHNMALPAWGTVAAQREMPLPLVTFDTHTDTRDPFTRDIFSGDYDANEVKKFYCGRSDFAFDKALHLSLCWVEYDEQIKLSCKCGYLSGYTTIFDTGLTGVDEASSMEEYDRRQKYNARYISREKWNAEHSEIVKNLPLPCILDFDLDYFRCAADMDDNFFASIRPLVKKAVAITIAKEPECFEFVNIDSSFTNQVALETLIEGIKSILESE